MKYTMNNEEKVLAVTALINIFSWNFQRHVYDILLNFWVYMYQVLVFCSPHGDNQMPGVVIKLKKLCEP